MFIIIFFLTEITWWGGFGKYTLFHQYLLTQVISHFTHRGN